MKGADEEGVGPLIGIRAEPLLSMSCHSSCAAPYVHLIFPVIEIEEGHSNS